MPAKRKKRKRGLLRRLRHHLQLFVLSYKTKRLSERLSSSNAKGTPDDHDFKGILNVLARLNTRVEALLQGTEPASLGPRHCTAAGGRLLHLAVALARLARDSLVDKKSSPDGRYRRETVRLHANVTILIGASLERNRGESFLRRATLACRSLLRAVHPPRLRAHFQFYDLYCKTGRLTEKLMFSIALHGAEGRTNYRETEEAIELLAKINILVGTLFGCNQHSSLDPLIVRAAEMLLGRAVKLARLLPDHGAVAQLHINVATLFRVIREPHKAQPHLHHAEEVCCRVVGRAHPDYAGCLSRLARHYRDIGNLEEGLRFFELALQVSEKVFGVDHPKTAPYLHDVAETLLSLGIYGKSLESARQTLEIRSDHFGQTHPDTADSLLLEAMILAKLGSGPGLVNARCMAGQAWQSYKKTLGVHDPNTASAMFTMASIARKSGVLVSSFLLEVFEVCLKAHGLEHWQTMEVASDLPLHFAHEGEPDIARSWCELAHRLASFNLTPNEVRSGRIHFSLGRSCIVMEEFDSAEKHFRTSQAIFEAHLGRNHPMVVETMKALSFLAESRGDNAEAISLLASSQDSEESRLCDSLTVGTTRERLQLLDRSEASDFGSIRLFLKSDPDDGMAARAAAATILRRKARELAAAYEVVRHLRQNTKGELCEVFRELAEVREMLAKDVLTPPLEASNSARGAARYKLHQEFRALEELERCLTSLARQTGARLPTISCDSVQEALPPDSALVEFIVYSPHDRLRGEIRIEIKGPTDLIEPWMRTGLRYVALVLRKFGVPKVVDLGAASEIDGAAKSLRLAIAGRDRANVLKQARCLDELTTARLQPYFSDVDNLIISPDGALCYVPFAALLCRDGRFLIEHYGVSFLSGGWELVKSDFTARAGGAPLLVGDPSYDNLPIRVDDNQEPEAKRSVDFLSDLLVTPLPETYEEVVTIGRLLGLSADRILTGSKACKKELVKVAGPMILHLATHGWFLDRSPGEDQVDSATFRSGLALAGFNKRQVAGRSNWGVLTAFETLSLDLWGTELAVLSACETHLGHLEDGRGVFGLGRALMLAGARTQVLSLWKIADQATKDLMIAFYRLLMEGVPRAEALRNVQLAAIRGEPLPLSETPLSSRGGRRVEVSEQTEDPRVAGSRHPYFWASFVLSGDTGPLPNLTTGGRCEGKPDPD